MTPEQKEADRLIELFMAHAKNENPPRPNRRFHAKACAAIHCRGVIDVLKKLNPDYEENTYWHPIDHWNKVLELLNQ